MDLFLEGFRWLIDPVNYSGPRGIPTRLWEHVQISLTAIGIGALIALPVGFLVGHTRRGEVLAVSAANVGRAMPSYGLIAIVFPFSLLYLPGRIGYSATLIGMAFLAIPPMLTNTYVGIQSVDRETVEAARGMGMSGWQVLSRLEVPLAAPLIMAGVRTAAVQVVATATLGALFGWGGLGRFIVDGFAVGVQGGGGPRLVGGATLVALLSILTEVGLGRVERLVTPRTAVRAASRRRLRRGDGRPSP